MFLIVDAGQDHPSPETQEKPEALPAAGQFSAQPGEGLTASEDEGGYGHALICLMALKDLCVSEACNADIADLGGSRYAPTLYNVGKGDRPAEVVLNPRTQQAIHAAIGVRASGTLLHGGDGHAVAASL